MKPRDALAEIVLNQKNTPILIVGAAVSFLRMQARTSFEQTLAEKIDKLIATELFEAAVHFDA